MPSGLADRSWYDRASDYESRYWHLYGSMKDYLQWNHFEALRHLPLQSASILDVGCGLGAFVAACQREGHDAYGLDWSARAIEAGRSYFDVQNLFAGTLEEFLRESPKKTWDVVTLFEVLEHIPEPRLFLSRIGELVRPGGELIISVPNRDRRPNVPDRMDYPPYHLTWWNTQALRTFLDSHGFQTLKVCGSPAWFSIEACLHLKALDLGLTSWAKRRATGGDATSPALQITAPFYLRALARAKRSSFAAAARALSPVLGPLTRPARLLAVAARQ
jgi:SAM-dependent methyltransferase